MDRDALLEVPEAADPSPRSNLVLGGVLAGLLTLATAWAYTEDTSGAEVAAGVRADPTAVYNPVTAGEPLPDGFRQLLPRDAILPVYDPEFVPGSAIAWADNTDVIGVTINGESKAYPVSFLNGRELVVDELGGEPILVSW